ncbi:MAG: hypothetical protein ABIZ91_00040 [Gemmatimonadaceae bacterium]
MLHRTWKSLGLLVVLAVIGVAAVPHVVPAQVTKEEKPEKVKRGGAYFITESEINAVVEENAYDIVQRLRPAMLRPRMASGTPEGEGGGIVAYVDNVRSGGTESLRNISRATIKEIRFINASDATQRFGTGHPAGAIIVVLRR